MKTEIMKAEHPTVIDHAVDILRNGGLVAFPTDTIYGIGAHLFNPLSVESLLAARGQGSERSVGILMADTADLAVVVQRVSLAAQRLAERFWPGPLTLVLPGHPNLPLKLMQTNSTVPSPGNGAVPVAVRIPDHPFLRALLRCSGPLAVSSASPVGRGYPKMAQDVLSLMNGRIHLLIDGGPVPGGVPSTVIDCMSDEIVELRGGPIAFQDILAVTG